MKIYDKETNKIFVQKSNIVLLSHSYVGIPKSIINKVYGGITIITNNNKFEFMEFNEPDEIEFFRKLDWIPEYCDYRDLTEKQILSCVEKINKEKDNMFIDYDKLKKKDLVKMKKLFSIYDLLELKTYSITEILLNNQGLNVIPFPEEVEHLIKTYNSSNSSLDKKENRISRLVKKLFNNI